LAWVLKAGKKKVKLENAKWVNFTFYLRVQDEWLLAKDLLLF
jgi:hypothetical protein